MAELIRNSVSVIRTYTNGHGIASNDPVAVFYRRHRCEFVQIFVSK